jgi:hypothetical protein
MMLRGKSGCIGGESDSGQDQLFRGHAGYFTSFAGVVMGVNAYVMF